jgi:prevent-host-death family protein
MMMTSIGTYAAKTHLPELLARVAHGEKILITRHGKPAAMLVPAPAEQKKDVKQVIEEFKAYSKRQGRTLDKLTAREMIEEGRRY